MNGLNVFKPLADIVMVPNAVVKVGLTDVSVNELYVDSKASTGS